MVLPHLTAWVNSSLYLVTWCQYLTEQYNKVCSCDMFSSEILILGLKIVSWKQKSFCLKMCKHHLYHTQCWLFSLDSSLQILRANTGAIVCVFVCQSPLRRLLQTCFCFCAEDEKWVTCLNYPFAGLHASVPRNCITWETSAKETQRHFWRMAAEQGRTQRNGRSDAAAREPRSSPCTRLKVHKPACLGQRSLSRHTFSL